MSGERPDQLIRVGEIVGDANAENERVACREKTSRLSLIGAPWLDVVVETHGDIELFFPIPVHVPEEEEAESIGVPLPSFIRRRYTLASRVRELGALALRLRELSAHPRRLGCQKNRYTDEQQRRRSTRAPRPQERKLPHHDSL